MRRAFILAGVLLAARAYAEPPPDILLFTRARTKMQQHLRNQPNYVCLETLERATREPRKKQALLLDVLRFEVAFVDRKELYAWPGSKRFEETELVDMVPGGGSIGTGAFASHAYNLFLSSSPRFLAGQWTELDGRRVARYPYEVAEITSGYRMRVAHVDWATVGYYGSVWIDSEREEVLRVEVIADQIPLRLGLRESRTMIYYDDVKIGGEGYRLPVRTIDITTTFGEYINRNEGRFSGCRQFVGESKLSFGDPPPEEAPTPQVTSEVTLPEGLTLQVQLTAPIDSTTSKTGDVIEAILAAPVKQKKQVLFDKGARVEGRLVRLQKVGTSIQAEIQFTSITGPAGRAGFTATPQVALPPAGTTQAQMIGRPQFQTGTRPGSVVITIESSRLTLLKGSRSNWVTVAPKKDS